MSSNLRKPVFEGMALSFSKLILCLAFLSFLSLQSARAINFYTEKNDLFEPEIHGDITLTSDWNTSFPGPRGSLDDGYRGFLDYRLEGHLPIYDYKNHRGTLITRIAGLGFLDENIDNFMDDPLIDIPEIFLTDSSRLYEGSDWKLDISFGKFATRRFFNKNEIYGDPFDIGEMRFTGALVNTLTLMTSINEFRDNDHRAFGSRLATGSYGFHLGLENLGDGYLRGLGFKQGFLLTQLEQTGDNFYGISEIYKRWESDHPSHLSLGLMYGQENLFRVQGATDNNYLVYASYAKQIDDFSYHLRYGTSFQNNALGDFTNHEYRFGFAYRLDKKNSLSSWLGYFDGSSSLGQDDNTFAWTSVYKHKFTPSTSVYLVAAQRFNQFNTFAVDNNDGYNVTFAVQMQYAK